MPGVFTGNGDTHSMHRNDNISSDSLQKVRITHPTGVIELEIPEGIHLPPPSSVALAKLLDVVPGENILELGCGAGLLAITAAKLGAGHVVAADLDPRALQAAARNAHINGVGKQIDFCRGSWYEAINPHESGTGRRLFHMIIATPPQTPGPVPFGPRYGGPDGTEFLCRIIEGAPDRLEPSSGRLWLLAISLAHPSRLLRLLEKCFSGVSLVHETQRVFTAEEYDAMTPGLFQYLSDLRTAGKSEFSETSDNRYAFRNLFIRASGPRKV